MCLGIGQLFCEDLQQGCLGGYLQREGGKIK